VKIPVVINSHFDCTLIGGASLDVSPACRYHSPPTLLLNVSGQVAAFWEIKKIHQAARDGNAEIRFLLDSVQAAQHTDSVNELSTAQVDDRQTGG